MGEHDDSLIISFDAQTEIVNADSSSDVEPTLRAESALDVGSENRDSKVGSPAPVGGNAQRTWPGARARRTRTTASSGVIFGRANPTVRGVGILAAATLVGGVVGLAVVNVVPGEANARTIPVTTPDVGFEPMLEVTPGRYYLGNGGLDYMDGRTAVVDVDSDGAVVGTEWGIEHSHCFKGQLEKGRIKGTLRGSYLVGSQLRSFDVPVVISGGGLNSMTEPFGETLRAGGVREMPLVFEQATESTVPLTTARAQEEFVACREVWATEPKSYYE